MIFFYKESKSKKGRKKNIFFVFCVGEGVGVVSDFCFQRSEIYTIFFFRGGQGVWNGRGSVARG